MIKALVSSALAWSIASSLWISPHSLAYFNEIAGGPTGGPRYLLGSNVDWGQDLLFLKRWIANHPKRGRSNWLTSAPLTQATLASDLLRLTNFRRARTALNGARFRPVGTRSVSIWSAEWALPLSRKMVRRFHSARSNCTLSSNQALRKIRLLNRYLSNYRHLKCRSRTTAESRITATVVAAPRREAVAEFGGAAAKRAARLSHAFALPYAERDDDRSKSQHHYDVHVDQPHAPGSRVRKRILRIGVKQLVSIAPVEFVRSNRPLGPICADQIVLVRPKVVDPCSRRESRHGKRRIWNFIIEAILG